MIKGILYWFAGLDMRSMRSPISFPSYFSAMPRQEDLESCSEERTEDERDIILSDLEVYNKVYNQECIKYESEESQNAEKES